MAIVELGTPEFMQDLLLHEGNMGATELINLFGFGPDGLPWKSMAIKSGRPVKGQDLVDSMKEELFTIHAVSALPDSDSLTIKIALDLMGFEAIPAPGILSRRYKKLARIMQRFPPFDHGAGQ